MSAVRKYRIEPKITRTRELDFGDPRNRKEDRIYIGKLGEIGPEVLVFFDITSAKVVAIVGKRGSGKSYTLGSLVESLCVYNKNSKIADFENEKATLLFDTLNIFWTTKIPVSKEGPKIVQKQYTLLQRWGMNPEKLNVKIWVPAGFRMPSMPADFEDFYIDISDFDIDDWTSLLNVDLVQDKMGQLIGETYLKVTQEGWTSMDNTFVKAKKDYSISDLINCIELDQHIQSEYHRETIRGILQQLKAFSTYEIFKRKGTELVNLIMPGRLSILLVNQLPEDFRAVLASAIIKKILSSRSRASFIEKMLLVSKNISEKKRKDLENELKNLVERVWVIIDEAQNLFPAGKKTAASDVFVRLVREGRNFGISVAFTSQQPSAVDTRVMAQVDNLFVHKLAIQRDIDDILKNIKCRQPTKISFGKDVLSFTDLTRDIKLGEAIVSSTEADRAFVLIVRPRVSVHGGFEL